MNNVSCYVKENAEVLKREDAHFKISVHSSLDFFEKWKWFQKEKDCTTPFIVKVVGTWADSEKDSKEKKKAKVIPKNKIARLHS